MDQVNKVQFNSLHDWAILPRKRKLKTENISKYTKAVQNSFEFYRANRRPEFCWSWRKANEMGWDLHSPIDITLLPFEDFELTAEINSEKLTSITNSMNFSQIWTRSDSKIAIRHGSWMRAYDFKVGDAYQSMFIPNGFNTVEWVLGWTAHIPDGFVLWFLPSKIQEGNVNVLGGVLKKSSLIEMHKKGIGISIGIQVEARTHILRGDFLGRFVIIPEYCLDIIEDV